MEKLLSFLISTIIFGFAGGYALAEEPSPPDPPEFTLFGTQYFREADVSGMQGRVIEIKSEPQSCEDIIWQGKLILDQSATWLQFRKQGIRRIQSKDLVFFQYTGFKFFIPYKEKRPNSVVFYDPFELMGYLYVIHKFKNCRADIAKSLVFVWPFGDTFPPNSKHEIQFMRKEEDRYLYLESIQGYPTDIYFCRNQIPAKKLDHLRQQLHLLDRYERQEFSDTFRNYTQTRERICGESLLKS